MGLIERRKPLEVGPGKLIVRPFFYHLLVGKYALKKKKQFRGIGTINIVHGDKGGEVRGHRAPRESPKKQATMA